MPCADRSADRSQVSALRLRFGAALVAVCVLAAPVVLAGPTGGKVVAGKAQIESSSALTRVRQLSERAAIDWRSFSIATGETVRFEQSLCRLLLTFLFRQPLSIGVVLTLS